MIDDLIKNLPKEIIDDAVNMHGHLAPGLIVGFKLAQRALKEIRPTKDDVVMLTSETTRCVPDGLQVVCRYLLEHGGYHVYFRVYDVGKLAIQVAKNHEDQFRLIINNDYIKENPTLDAWANQGKCEKIPAKKIQDALWSIDIDKGIVKKPFKKVMRPDIEGKDIVACPGCGEQTTRLAMVTYKGGVVCKACALFQKPKNGA
nr:formylmethanofuran dehydrogenase subunit E family protein [Candidatus Sigynarchaeum springense]